MNNDNGRDPVEDFFAAERDSVRPLHGDDARWTEIVAGSRTSGRSWFGYAAGAAAAVVLVSAAGWGLSAAHRNTVTPVGSPPVTRTVLVTAPTPTPEYKSTPGTTPQATGGGVATTTNAPPVSTTPASKGVPATFAVISVSTAKGGLLYALGSTACLGSPCTAVARSSDNGASWNLVSSFTTSVAPSRQAPGAVGSAATLSQIRFATPMVGWVFGGGIKQTHDGGRTWTDYEHGGGDVVDLATDGKDVVLTVADRCDTSLCHGDIRVLRAPAGAAAATDVAGTIPGGSGVRSADISWRGGKALVTPVVDGAGAQTQPQVVQVHGLHPVAPTGCANQNGIARIVAPASLDSTLFALCPNGADAGHVEFGVARSTDLGASWTLAQGTGARLVGGGLTSFAATDAKHLLAVSGGTADLHGSMTLSEDGGATWRDPKSAPSMPARGWAWVGAPGGSVYYAIPVGGDGSYWLSKDHGDTWTAVRVAG